MSSVRNNNTTKKKKQKGTEEGLQASPGMVLAYGRRDTREAGNIDGCFFSL